MRLAASSALAAAMLFVSLPSHAQTFAPGYPVCMKVIQGSGDGGNEWINCSYATMAQCQASASGLAGMCMINPYGSLAQAPAPAPGRTYRRAQRVYQ